MGFSEHFGHFLMLSNSSNPLTYLIAVAGWQRGPFNGSGPLQWISINKFKVSKPAKGSES